MCVFLLQAPVLADQERGGFHGTDERGALYRVSCACTSSWAIRWSSWIKRRPLAWRTLALLCRTPCLPLGRGSINYSDLWPPSTTRYSLSSSPSVVVDELNDFHSSQKEEVKAADRVWTMKRNPRLASPLPPLHCGYRQPTHHALQFQLVALARTTTTRLAPEAGGSPFGSGFMTSASSCLTTTAGSSKSRRCLNCPSHPSAQFFFGTESLSL